MNTISSSTYRIQLHKGFTLKKLLDIIDYLHRLGISTIYAAPILKSNPGSVHGYDVVDPHVIDPEIGSVNDLKKISRELKKRGMTWLQDIVPNHMAFSVSNERLMDVLERGQLSPYSTYFDIDWNHSNPSLKGKLLVPFLGKAIDACIADDELTIAFGRAGFTINYLQTSYPLSIQTYEYLLSFDSELYQVKNQLPALRKASMQSWRLKKEIFINALLLDPTTSAKIENVLSRINQNPDDLRKLLLRQNYLLTYWKNASREINYRRFFTVNELICLRMEDEKVFEEYHKYLMKLFDTGFVQGFRIDHIDGLQNPGEYTRRLRKRLGPGAYIIAEKILESRERIEESWPIEGTSGYEFLAFVNQLLTDREGAKRLLTFYRQLFPNLPSYKDIVLHNKQKILRQHMAGEWENLFRLMKSGNVTGNLDDERLKAAIGILMVYFPVYRIYPERLPLTGGDFEIVSGTISKAIAENEAYRHELEFLNDIFLKPIDEPLSAGVLTFLQRMMQFTGPLTAKGVEDTTFYIFNALISHDEVGDSPSRLGISIREFHSRMIERQKFTPYSLNTTSTHDTKRGEDSRIRLNVLCELSSEWIELVHVWMDVNQKHKTQKGDQVAPSKNDEYFIYQSIVGGFPEDFVVTEEFVQRLQTYQTKVVREAKLFSDWAEPDEAYENGCSDFIASILTPESDFLKSFVPFVKELTERADLYALSQLLIKLTAPGIPDTYQGCELWDLSYVDPDNRRPVDFQKRESLLNQLLVQEKAGLQNVLTFLSEHRSSGVGKLFVSQKILSFRKKFNDLFIEGEYLPLEVVSNRAVAMAYARHSLDKWLVVIVPLGKREGSASTEDLSDGYINLPETSPDHWTNIVTGETIQTQRKLLLSRCLATFPIGAWTNL